MQNTFALVCLKFNDVTPSGLVYKIPYCLDIHAINSGIQRISTIVAIRAWPSFRSSASREQRYLAYNIRSESNYNQL